VVNFYGRKAVRSLPSWGDRLGQYGIKLKGELLGLWDPQNRDPPRRRRKYHPQNLQLFAETDFSVGLFSPPRRVGVLISDIYMYLPYMCMEG